MASSKESCEPDITEILLSFDPEEHTEKYRRYLRCIEETQDSTLAPSGSRVAWLAFLPDDYLNLCHGFRDLPEISNENPYTGPSSNEDQNLELFSPWATSGPSVEAAIANTNLTIFQSLANGSNFKIYLKSVQTSESVLVPSSSRIESSQVDQGEDVNCLGFCDLEESQHGCYNSGPRSPRSLQETGDALLRYAQENDETCLEEMQSRSILENDSLQRCDPETVESMLKHEQQEDECLIAAAPANPGLSKDVAKMTDYSEFKPPPTESFRDGVSQEPQSGPEESVRQRMTNQESSLPVLDRTVPSSGYGTGNAVVAEDGYAAAARAPTYRKMNPPSANQDSCHFEDMEESEERTKGALREVRKGRPHRGLVKATGVLCSKEPAEYEDSSEDSEASQWESRILQAVSS